MSSDDRSASEIAEAREEHRAMRLFVCFCFAASGLVLALPFLAGVAGCSSILCATVGAAGLVAFGRDIFRTPMRMFCASCGKYVPSDAPWICGYCGASNSGNWQSFLHKCANCQRQPPGFKCPHAGCASGIFKENDDASRSHWAYRQGDSAPAPLPPLAPADVAEFERDLRRLDQDIRLTKLRRELEVAKRAYDRVREPEEAKAEPERDPVEAVLQRIQQATRKEEAVTAYVAECKERWTKEGRPKEDVDRLTMRLKAVTTQVLAATDGR